MDKPKTTTTVFTAINFREQIAVEEDGTVWAFSQLLDSDGDELSGEVFQDEIAVIVVEHPSGEAWSTIVIADFEDVKPFN